MAAAVTLADAGVAVRVYEAAPDLGGRARRVVVNGVALDNGLHVLIGAHRETLRLISPRAPDSARGAHAFCARLEHPSPLPVESGAACRRRCTSHAACSPHAARRGPNAWRRSDSFGRCALRDFRLPHDMPVEALLAAHGQSGAFARHFWRPLCLAALNTPPEIASAQIFLNVLRDGLAASRDAADILIARTDLTALFPAPAAEYVQRTRRTRDSRDARSRGSR